MPLRHSASSGQALGYYSPGNTPALGLVSEVMVGDDRPPGIPLGRSYQQVRDFSLKHRVSWKPDGVPDLFQFQVLLHLGLGKSGITPEQHPPSPLLVSFQHRLKEFLPALDAMDVAGS